MTTTIGPHTRITGRITGDADLLVQGAVDGHVDLKSNLVIAPSGSVSGNVRAISVRIEGRLEGTLEAEHVHLTSSARVLADQITATLLQMDDGARVKAELVMNLNGAATPASTAKPVSVPKPTSRPVAAIPARPAFQATPVSAARTVPTAAAAAAPHVTTVVTVEDEVEAATASNTSSTSNAAYDAMTVKELRDRLRELDLPVSGTKQELADRLAEAES